MPGYRDQYPRAITPRLGPIYTRCPICQAQVWGKAKRSASDNQRSFGLAVALAEHKRRRHPENGDEDDD